MRAFVLTALVVATSGCSHITVLPRVADVVAPQEVHAVIRGDGSIARYSDAVLEPAQMLCPDGSRTRCKRLDPDDLVEVEATAGQRFGPIQVRAKHPELAPFGWLILVVGGLTSIIVPSVAIATEGDGFFSGLAEGAYILAGIGGFTLSVAIGGALIYFGNNPLVLSAAW